MVKHARQKADNSPVTLADTAEGLRRLARQQVAAAVQARRTAEAFDRGEAGEAVVRGLVSQLDGWAALHHRHWPGTRQADLDHVLVGPGGVIVLDSKNWSAELCVEGGRLWRGQEDATDDVEGLLAQITAVEEVLAPHGLAPAAVTGALVLVGQALRLLKVGRGLVVASAQLLDWLRALPPRLTETDVAALRAVLEVELPPYQAPPVQAAVVPARPRPRTVSVDQEQLFPVAELDLADLERARQLPLEQWMTYLHPAQLSAVRRRYRGPCRVRGPAGCGKTVVALHRAAYLAEQEHGELLLASYVRTLPAVLATLYGRLSPHTAERVTSRGVHALALDLLAGAGVRVRVDASTIRTCFARAWARVGRDHLGELLTASYVEEEVQHVIKGRGITDPAVYAALPRTGRRTRLDAEQRRRVWDVYVEYERLLESKGVHDFPGVLAAALQVVEQGLGPRYRFVVVDEVQDLDLLAVRLLAGLVSDERDGLTLVGDGQQSLYPGGYTLKEAGLSVVGRSTVLEVNYRNTREIVEAACEVVAVDDFDDLEDLLEPGGRPVTAIREGGRVERVVARDPRSAYVALVARLGEDQALGLDPADAAVLCRTRAEAADVHRHLRGAGLGTVDLEDYDGTPAAAVKVGTVKRAKGLEFGRVYVPRVDGYRSAGDELERAQRDRRELFVAMTRARDGLWLCEVRP